MAKLFVENTGKTVFQCNFLKKVKGSIIKAQKGQNQKQRHKHYVARENALEESRKQGNL